jgi:hypothetical protein
MKKIYPFVWAAVLALFPVSVRATQPYEHAAGIRAGYTSGLTYKGFFLHSMRAVEVCAEYNRHGLNISALYVMHAELSRNGKWLLYFGAGAFGGTWEDESSAGILALGGLEYMVRKVPLNFGFDWRPMLNLYRSFDDDLLDLGITIRYRFSL